MKDVAQASIRPKEALAWISKVQKAISIDDFSRFEEFRDAGLQIDCCFFKDIKSPFWP